MGRCSGCGDEVWGVLNNGVECTSYGIDIIRSGLRFFGVVRVQSHRFLFVGLEGVAGKHLLKNSTDRCCAIELRTMEVGATQLRIDNVLVRS